ncbi:MAG TPA: 50S ribosomal protein L9 [Actinomycetota bacterium]|nr:50S ribosomal protein L9 [Actinomycetota bacterium]
MKVVLADDVVKLGRKGDIVIVADGYARNYLLPRGLALPATKGAVQQAESMQRARAERAAREREEATARVTALSASPVYISARAGQEGRLFGSVTSSDVARAIEEQLGEVVDRHKVRLEDPIRSLGTHHVEVHLHEEVKATVTVEVIAHEEETEPE